MSHELIVPDLGLDEHPITLSLWLVKRGTRVVEGEPIAEIHAGAATIDLAAPCDGVLSEILAMEDDTLEVGQTLGIITAVARTED